MTALIASDGTAASKLTFGTMQFGGKADKAASHAMFEAALAAGITHFDTAYVYTDGASETFLGDMIKPHRDRLVIATKAAYVGGSTKANILKHFDISRQRLQLDMVDLLYLHRFDDGTDLAETFDALAELKQAKAIRYIGVSNFAAWQVMKAQTVCGAFDMGIDVIQPMYSLVKRQAEVEIMPMCIDQTIEIVPYSPLGGGLLTGKYAQGGTGRLTEDDRYAARYGQPWMHDAAVAFAQLAAREGVAPATLAVAWAAAHASQPKPIVSARSVDQLTPSLDAMTTRLSPDLYAEISALTPTPAPATDRLEEA
ncbi:General stress protein 69 [Ascidiaceihabitans donghaensis]|uniref:General stress protein 69 n=1 Tax=Ascidiaceihabitans donghaensis TaxID=1510460 RepID=A0A2R8BGZ3_9RHOB|nr:aldo/keto reductase [Ascidiaceihabitans donghaensis]SPH22331.1 General stress protein 69 [Ascidiaceihabitans donghaensis]